MTVLFLLIQIFPKSGYQVLPLVVEVLFSENSFAPVIFHVFECGVALENVFSLVSLHVAVDLL